MAGITSHNLVVKVDNAAGVLTAVSQRAAAEIARAVAEIDVSSAGEDDMEYEPGQGSSTASWSGPWNAADDALFDGILGQRDKDVEVFPNGEDAGEVKKAAKGFVSAYTSSLTLGSAGQYSISFRVSGAVTRTTV